MKSTTDRLTSRHENTRKFPLEYAIFNTTIAQRIKKPQRGENLCLNFIHFLSQICFSEVFMRCTVDPEACHSETLCSFWEFLIEEKIS